MSIAEPIARNPASFRDPSGFVFEHEDRIFRAIDQETLTLISDLQNEGLWDRLIDSGKMVRSWIVTDEQTLASLRSYATQEYTFLEHERIEILSYPYEWSPAMLAEAGLATLELQIELIQHGYSLKDATAYNIQFVNGKPIFIDIPSIERPERLDIWIALGQFSRMFTLPLLLHEKKGYDLRSYFLGNLDGCDVREVQRAFSRWELLKPGLWMDVTLPYLMSRASDNRASRTKSVAKIEHKETSSAAQLLNLRRLRNKLVRSARSTSSTGHWSDYTSTCSYSNHAEEAKVTAIREFLHEHEPNCVLDVGCNTGHYAHLAADSGADVIALDNDAACVDRLYQRVRQSAAPILPLCMNIANPSPAIGFCNRERPDFFQRVKPDCVFALALIHHLHVSANLPIVGIRDMFAELTQRHLVLEFVPTDDVMFQQLMRYRRDLYADFTLERCKDIFAKTFTLIDEQPVADSPRTLLFFAKS